MVSAVAGYHEVVAAGAPSEEDAEGGGGQAFPMRFRRMGQYTLFRLKRRPTRRPIWKPSWLIWSSSSPL
jgi:hypothetical protein